MSPTPRSHNSRAGDRRTRFLSVPVLDRSGRLVGVKIMTETERDQLIADVPRKALTDRQMKWAEKLYWRWAKQTFGQTLQDWVERLEHVEHPHNALVMFGRMEKVADQVWRHATSKGFERSQIDRAVVLSIADAMIDVAKETGVSEEFVALILKVYRDAYCVPAKRVNDNDRT